MDPFTIAAAASAGGSLLSSIFGKRSADKANELNAKIAKKNFKAEQRAREEAIAEARRINDLTLEESRKARAEGREDWMLDRDDRLSLYSVNRDDTLRLHDQARGDTLENQEYNRAMFERARGDAQSELLYSRMMFERARGDALEEQKYQRALEKRDFELQREREQDAKLGQTDASGNRTYFKPGVGWVTELSPEQEALRVDSEAEQQRQLREGADRAAQTEARASERRGREDILATDAEREFRDLRREDPSALRDVLLARGAAARNAGNDRVGDVVARQAIRAGGGANAAELMAMSRGASDQEASRQAAIEAELQARQESERSFGARRDEASKLYDYFRRASTTNETGAPGAFTPNAPGMTDPVTGGTGGGNTGSGVLPSMGVPSFQSAAMQPSGGGASFSIPSMPGYSSGGVPNLPNVGYNQGATQMLLSALQSAPQKMGVTPNNSTANLISGVGNAGMSVMNWYQNQKLNDAIMNSFGTGRANSGAV